MKLEETANFESQEPLDPLNQFSASSPKVILNVAVPKTSENSQETHM